MRIGFNPTSLFFWSISHYISWTLLYHNTAWITNLTWFYSKIEIDMSDRHYSPIWAKKIDFKLLRVCLTNHKMFVTFFKMCHHWKHIYRIEGRNNHIYLDGKYAYLLRFHFHSPKRVIEPSSCFYGISLNVHILDTFIS